MHLSFGKDVKTLKEVLPCYLPTGSEGYFLHVVVEDLEAYNSRFQEVWYVITNRWCDARWPSVGYAPSSQGNRSSRRRRLWLADLPDVEILARQVSLNQGRIAEEAKGIYRYLWPAYQAPKTGVSIVQEQVVLDTETAFPKQGAKKPAWPNSALDRITIVRDIIANQPSPVTLDSVATSFKRRPKGDDLQDILTLLSG